MEKKLYKLSDMWKGWYSLPRDVIMEGDYYYQNQNDIPKHQNLIAITPADATEFYEGEGLE